MTLFIEHLLYTTFLSIFHGLFNPDNSAST